MNGRTNDNHPNTLEREREVNRTARKWTPFKHFSWVFLFLFFYLHQFSSVQFSRSVMSNSLWPHEPQHARPPCPSPTPRVHPNSCPLSQWCHPAISSSVVPFSSRPQTFPASGSFHGKMLIKQAKIKYNSNMCLKIFTCPGTQNWLRK